MRNLVQMRGNLLQFALSLKDRFGDAARYRVGKIDFLLFSHPRHYRAVLLENTESFRKPLMIAKQMQPLLRGAIGIAEGSAWVHRRKIVHEALAKIDDDVIIQSAVHQTKRIVLSKSPDHLDATDAMERILSASSAQITLGLQFERYFDEIYQHTCTALDMLATKISSFLPVWIPGTPSYKKFSGVASRFAELTEQARLACLERGDLESQSLLAGLMAAKGEGRTATPKEVCEEGAMLFVGGKETAGPVAAWMAYFLAKHPDFQEQCIRELREILAGQEPCAERISQLKHLEAAYKEALRLCPPAFMFAREAVKDTTIDGFDVPRGSMVFLFIYATQRDPRWFDEPHEFRPQRFLEGLPRDAALAFAPFGMGKRACPGGHISTLQTIASFATILQKHRLVWDPANEEPVPQIKMGYRPPLGMFLKVDDLDAKSPAIPGLLADNPLALRPAQG